MGATSTVCPGSGAGQRQRRRAFCLREGELMATTVASRADTAPSPGVRACCMLNPHDGRNPITFPTRLPDPSALGRHSFGGSNDVVGQVYCCRAGFVDLGHLRDHIDLTYYYYWNLVKGGANRAGGEIRPYGIGQGHSSAGE